MPRSDAEDEHGRPDPLAERLRDPAYARAFHEYRDIVLRNAEAAVRSAHRRQLHVRHGAPRVTTRKRTSARA